MRGPRVVQLLAVIDSFDPRRHVADEHESTVCWAGPVGVELMHVCLDVSSFVTQYFLRKIKKKLGSSSQNFAFSSISVLSS